MQTYDFGSIRRMTSDSRTIAFNTSLPQYKIQQVKNKLFLVANSQNNKVCEWWARLIQGEYSQDDIWHLKRALDGKELEIE